MEKNQHEEKAGELFLSKVKYFYIEFSGLFYMKLCGITREKVF